MENEVDLSSANPLDLTPKGALAIENLDTITPINPQRPVQLAQNAGPGSIGGGILGTNRLNIQPNPEVNPLDNAEAIATQRRNNLQKAASSPMGQFLFPDETRQWAKEAEDESLKINQIKQQRQQQVDVQMAARNRGLTRTLGPNATQETLTEESLREMKEGNYNAYKGLVGAGQGARAQLYMPEFVQSLGKQTEAGQKAVNELNQATNQSEYNSIRNGILKNAKDKGHEYSAGSLGLDENSIPKSKLQWEKDRGAATAKLNDASAIVEDFKQKQAALSQAVPISDEKVAKSVTDNISGFNGQAFPNTQAVTLPGAGGAQGALLKQPGSKDLTNYGKENGWSNLSDAEIAVAEKQLNSEQFKGVLGKTKTSKDFFLTAMDDGMYARSAGLAALNDKFGAVERNVAEGSRGSGTIGLTKQLENQYGVPEHLANAVVKARSEIKSWIEGGQKGPMPKLSAQSIEGMKYVATATYKQDLKELDRLALPAFTIGYAGGGMDKLGLDKEIQNDPYLKEVNQRGTEKYKEYVDKFPFLINGDRRILLRQDAQVPGMIPAGAYAKTLTPTEQRGNAATGSTTLPATPAANGPPSPAGGGGGTPPVVPTAISKNPVALTVYGAAGEAAANLGSTTAAARNVATVVTSAANSESAFNPNATHDGGIGYGLFGHNQDRLKAMQTFAGTKPGEPIKPETQAAFFAKELSQAANKDQFIKDTVNNPNAGAVDLTKVQIRLEKPAGYTGPGSEEKVASWQSRLNNTRALMQGGTAQPTAEQIAAYNANKESFAAQRAKMAASATTNAANIAPTLGAVAGMPLGPAGSIAGGAAGGAVRQYFNGGAGYTDQMVRGAAQAIPAAIPGVGPLAIAARVVAGGAVPAAEKLYDTGGQDVAGAIESGAAGAAGSVAGEALGAGAGILGHSIWNRLSKAGQTEMLAAAKTVATAEPKIADAAGKMVDNPAYIKAVDALKSIGKSPEQAAHDYRSWEAGQTERQAIGQRPAEVAKANAVKEMNAVRDEATATNNTFVNDLAKGNKPPLTEGPLSKIRTEENLAGKVPEEFKGDAVHAERLMRAHAENWNEKWQQTGVARTELLEKERIALRDGKTDEAKAMRTLADSVRGYQEKIAVAIQGAEKAKPLMARLAKADDAYRKAMTASGDGDVVKAIAAGGNKGTEVRRAYDDVVGNDVQAKRLVDKLVAIEKASAGGPLTRTMVAIGAALHGMPQVTAMIGYNELRKLVDKHMTLKAAGGTVKLETLLRKEISSKGYARRAGSVIGSSIGGQAAQ